MRRRRWRHPVIDNQQWRSRLHNGYRCNAVSVGGKARDILLRHRRHTVASLDIDSGKRLAVKKNFETQDLSWLRQVWIGERNDFQIMTDHFLPWCVRPSQRLGKFP